MAEITLMYGEKLKMQNIFSLLKTQKLSATFATVSLKKDQQLIIESNSNLINQYFLY